MTWQEPNKKRGEAARYGLRIWRTERLTTTASGNPRFRIWFEDDTTTWFQTSSDASCAYDVDNLSGRGGLIDIVLTRSGRIIYMREAR
jgi:hypothetical protein